MSLTLNVVIYVYCNTYISTSFQLFKQLKFLHRYVITLQFICTMMIPVILTPFHYKEKEERKKNLVVKNLVHKSK